MAKTYIKPETKTIKVEAPQILAGSETIDQKGYYGTGSGITLGAKGFSFEEEEEMSEE